jgi:hypothetical protein
VKGVWVHNIDDTEILCTVAMVTLPLPVSIHFSYVVRFIFLLCFILILPQADTVIPICMVCLDDFYNWLITMIYFVQADP